MLLKIITIEKEKGSILQQPTETVRFPLSEEDQQLITSMKDKLFELGGVGLAAPQIKSKKSIAIIYIPEKVALLRDNAIPYPMHALINPEYEPIDGSRLISGFEGCYSVESRAGWVPRYDSIKLRYQDEKGSTHTTIESGFYARILQHEIDHLNGILITERLTPDCMQGTVEEMLKLRREKLSAEKKELFDEFVQQN